MKIAENFSLRMYLQMKEIYSDGNAPIYVKVAVTQFSSPNCLVLKR
jgi:hypothetical protein